MKELLSSYRDSGCLFKGLGIRDVIYAAILGTYIESVVYSKLLGLPDSGTLD